ncbi:hypothetical protein QFZ48_006274 [Chitinophaga sp. W2I13]
MLSFSLITLIILITWILFGDFKGFREIEAEYIAYISRNPLKSKVIKSK